MTPNITRYRNETSGQPALTIDSRSQQEEMIEPGAIALTHEAYLLVAMNTNPHYPLTFIPTIMDHFVDVQNVIQQEEVPPFQTPTQ